MRISWNWLSELVDLSKLGGPQELADLLTQRGLEVEEIRNPAQGLDKVISAQILEKKPHPQADRLSLCKVSTGSGDPLDIVCGAQNMKSGDKVALAQIGAHLPNGLKIAQSKIRGETSQGMLCSEDELGLEAQSEGIIILPGNTPLGKPIADVLGMNDVIFTFKLTANRGDCLSHFGMAREIAAALGQEPKRPDAKPVEFSKSPLPIHLEAGEDAPQFYGCLIEGVKVGPSPEWVVKKLEAVGSRSISNIVDATNLVMLELGHPVHAYDADLIEGGEIGVRRAKKGESLRLLDDSEIQLEGWELVIRDGKRAVGLAGVMGGGNSEVRDGTTRVFLECAEFAPTLVRRAASRHQKRTDASQRFEKGIDPQALPFVISRLATLVAQLAGGTVRGAGFVAQPSRQPGASGLSRKIPVVPEYFNEFLGMDLSESQIRSSLQSLECLVQEKGEHWEVIPPSYRRDLNIKEDLAEEVARSVGYDRIPSTIPVLTSQPSPSAGMVAQELVSRAKNALVEAGLVETINYAFTSSAWLKKFDLSSTVRVINPLSEEHEAMVPSLLPGLIRNAVDNWRHHFGSEPLPIRLFELRPTFHAQGEVAATSETDTGVKEKWKLALALSGPRFASGLRNELGETDFYDLKGVLELLFDELGTRGVRVSPLSATRSPDAPCVSFFHPGQSIEILIGKDVAGYAGLLHPAKARDLKLRAPLWLVELDWETVARLSRQATEPRSFKPWSEFPPMERDFALVVKDDVAADKITQVALKAGKPLAKVAKIFDIYKGSQVAEGMTSVAVRVIFFEEGRSLQESETETASSRILDAWKKELGAELRGG